MMRKNEKYIPPVIFHPGVMLTEKLDELKMSVKEFAVRSHKPEKTIHDVLSGASSITPGMAIQFENVLRIPARFWLKAQRDYDEFIARQRQQKTLESAVEWMKNFPFADMVQKGYIPGAKSTLEKVKVIFAYFGIAQYEAWENYYQKQTLCTAFRLSLAGLKNQHSLSAWLRYGEIAVAQNNIGINYSPEKLKQYIPRMLELANYCPDDFMSRLVDMCVESGIVLVYAPHIKNSKAQGATRWVNGCPLVQISDCRKKYDIFWFSFFHEIGHILLHNKRDIFLEGIAYAEKSPEKEQEADSFAAKHLVPPDVEKLLREINYSDINISEISQKTGIHLAFLVGRMHYLQILPPRIGNKYIPMVNFSE